MNEQNFEEPINSADNIQPTDQAANIPVLNSDPVVEKYPLGPDILQGMPMSETATADAPLDDPIVHETSLVEPGNYSAPVSAVAESPAPLLNREDSEQLRTRWNEIQGKFVDEPRDAVQQADELVAEVVQKIIKMFASEHSSLDSQWNQGMDVSTEDLRKALQHYRAFFNRLVA
jgi:hypothetical protein